MVESKYLESTERWRKAGIAAMRGSCSSCFFGQSGLGFRVVKDDCMYSAATRVALNMRERERGCTLSTNQRETPTCIPVDTFDPAITFISCIRVSSHTRYLRIELGHLSRAYTSRLGERVKGRSILAPFCSHHTASHIHQTHNLYPSSTHLDGGPNPPRVHWS